MLETGVSSGSGCFLFFVFLSNELTVVSSVFKKDSAALALQNMTPQDLWGCALLSGNKSLAMNPLCDMGCDM